MDEASRRPVVQELAERLACAEQNRQAIAPLSSERPTMAADEAYAIQRALIHLHEGRGERIVAFKGGLTSKAKQLQMGVSEPIYGVITDRMVLDNGEPLMVANFIHPRAEPEIACFLGADLRGPGVNRDAALASIVALAPAIEILDSRYENFSFTLPDVVADNASAARVAIGEARISPVDLDLRLMGAVFEKNGEVVESAAGAAILGHPAEAIAWVANKLAATGEYLRAGSFVIPGALTNAHAISAGDVFQVTLDRVGALTLRCV